MKKHGFVQDIGFWAIMVLIFAIILIVGGVINDRLTTQYQASDASTTAKDIQKTASDRYESIWDNSFLFFYILFGLSIVLVLYSITSNPALFLVGLVLIAIIALPIAIIGNAFDTFQSSDSMTAEADSMPILGWLMGHILEIGIGIALIGAVLLYSRVGGGY